MRGRSGFASLIGNREPIVLLRQIFGMGRAKRYVITIADDNRAPLDDLCKKLNAPMPPAMCSRPVAVIETGRR
jgi:hypothetical protein